MVLHSGKQLLDLLGVSMLDDRLAELFRDLDVPVPPVKHDRTTDLAVPAC